MNTTQDAVPLVLFGIILQSKLKFHLDKNSNFYRRTGPKTTYKTISKFNSRSFNKEEVMQQTYILIEKREKGETSGEKDEVDGSVNPRHGNNITFRRRHGLLDPGERVAALGPSFRWLQPLEDPVGEVHHIVPRLTR